MRALIGGECDVGSDHAWALQGSVAGRAMPFYVVERLLPGATVETMEIVGRAAEDMAREFAEHGRLVRYVRSTFIPGESRCQSLFEAPNADLVQELNDAAQLPYSRIVLALEYPGEAAAGSDRAGKPDYQD